MREWLERELDGMFVSVDDGQVVFYPFGPLFRAFALFDSASEPIIKSHLRRFYVTFVVAIFLAIVVGYVLSVGVWPLVLVCIVWQLFYLRIPRRLSHVLLPLPRGLGLRFQARWQNEERIWKPIAGFLIFGVIFAVALVIRPHLLIGVGIFILAISFTLSVTMLYVRNRELREFGAPADQSVDPSK